MKPVRMNKTAVTMSPTTIFQPALKRLSLKSPQRMTIAIADICWQRKWNRIESQYNSTEVESISLPGGKAPKIPPNSVGRNSFGDISGPEYPRIDNWNRKIFEMGYVARCKGGVACEGDPRDHRVAKFHGSSLFVT